MTVQRNSKDMYFCAHRFNSTMTDVKWFESQNPCRKFNLAEVSASDARERDIKHHVVCSKSSDIKWLLKQSNHRKQCQKTLELILNARGLSRELNIIEIESVCC